MLDPNSMHTLRVASFLPVSAVAAQEQPAVKVAPPPVVQAAAGAPTKPPDPNQYAGAAKAWFPELEQRIEVHAGEKEGRGAFRFKNPRSEVIEWKQLMGSCTCSHALVLLGDRKYELRPKPAHLAQITGEPGAEQRRDVDSIPVEPGQEGEVQVYVDTQVMKGPKVVSVDIHTTDGLVP